jgi:hypothetical protein
MRSIILLGYAWGTTVIYIFCIFWLSNLPSLGEAGESSESIKTIYRLVIYAFLFLLVYRSIIFTLKSTVDRLAFWRSKREQIEDLEFVLVIEILVVILAMGLSTLIAFIDEFIQFHVEDRKAEIVDVLVSFMAITLAATITYSSPLIVEIELVLKEKFLGRNKIK